MIKIICLQFSIKCKVLDAIDVLCVDELKPRRLGKGFSQNEFILRSPRPVRMVQSTKKLSMFANPSHVVGGTSFSENESDKNYMYLI